jgi:aspartate/methionine/tyrosine aminotransferase
VIPALLQAGFKIEHSQAGLYIWCSNGLSDWEQVSWFSERGIIVTPGSFYGEQGAKNIRIAMTATDQNITKFIERIS